MAEAQPPQDDPAAAAAAAQGAPTPPSQPAAEAAPAVVVDPALAAAIGADAPADQAALDQFSIDELLKQASFDDPTKLPEAQTPEAIAAVAAMAAEFKL